MKYYSGILSTRSELVWHARKIGHLRLAQLQTWSQHEKRAKVSGIWKPNHALFYCLYVRPYTEQLAIFSRHLNMYSSRVPRAKTKPDNLFACASYENCHMKVLPVAAKAFRQCSCNMNQYEIMWCWRVRGGIFVHLRPNIFTFTGFSCPLIWAKIVRIYARTWFFEPPRLRDHTRTSKNPKKLPKNVHFAPGGPLGIIVICKYTCAKNPKNLNFVEICLFKSPRSLGTIGCFLDLHNGAARGP